MHRSLRWLPAFALIPIVIAALPDKPEPVVVPSVFRWRNAYWMDGNEEQAIRRNDIQRVYMKLLDIDWNSAHGAHPVSTVNVPYQWKNYSGTGGEWTGKVELVPCIYITNNTFLQITDPEVDELATNLLRKLRMESPAKIHGVMLDCDWSERTKKRFFRLVGIMNDSLDVPLTATIRLHQYAQPKKTGIPPADRGMLMPYNVGNITEPGNLNSIFDRATAAPYFASSEPYPLPLDIGLPAFSWGVQFRKGTFVGILKQEQVYDAMNSGLLSGATHGVLHVVNENNEAMPQLHLGDEIRTETITPELIAQVTELARTAVNSDTLAVAYFEAGASTFQRMGHGEVKAGFSAFGKVRPDHYPVEDQAMPVEDAAVDTVWSLPDTTPIYAPFAIPER